MGHKGYMMTKQHEALKLALEALDCPGKAKTADEQAAITALRAALAEPPIAWLPPEPPPECQTEAEKTAFAFGWWKASEMHRKPVQQQEHVALETVYETIIHWDECGGKRSRRELARRIVALYTSPQLSKPWVELTDEEIDLFINGRGDEDDKDYVEPTGDGFGLTDADLVQLVRRAEAKLREKNTGEQP